MIVCYMVCSVIIKYFKGFKWKMVVKFVIVILVGLMRVYLCIDIDLCLMIDK